MKNFSTLLTILALALAAYLAIELVRTRALLRAALDPLHSAPAELLRRAGSVPAVRRPKESGAGTAMLDAELRAKDQQLADVRQHLAVVMEALVHEQTSSTHAATQTLDDGTVIYGPGAKIYLRNGMVVSSPSGTMVSDSSQTHVDGDLEIARPDGGVMRMNNAFVSVEKDRISIDAALVELVKH